MHGQPFNPSQASGECRWCGRKLRKYRWANGPDDKRRGDYGDNHFCGMRCGYEFGLRLAELGKRLVKVVRGA